MVLRSVLAWDILVVVLMGFLTFPELLVVLRTVVAVLDVDDVPSFARPYASPLFVRVRVLVEPVFLTPVVPSWTVRVRAAVPEDLSDLGSVLLTP